MSEEKKSGAQKALDKFFLNQMEAQRKELMGTPVEKRRKNERPEFDLVVKPLVKWLRANGFDVDIVEAKAVYSHSAGRYLNGQAVAGFADVVGNDQHGHAVYVECKAPGKRSTLREAQREFLGRKIQSGAFACAVDSIELFVNIYKRWKDLERSEEKKAYLTSALPKKAKEEQVDPLLGF